MSEREDERKRSSTRWRSREESRGKGPRSSNEEHRSRGSGRSEEPRLRENDRSGEENRSREGFRGRDDSRSKEKGRTRTGRDKEETFSQDARDGGNRSKYERKEEKSGRKRSRSRSSPRAESMEAKKAKNDHGKKNVVHGVGEESSEAKKLAREFDRERNAELERERTAERGGFGRGRGGRGGRGRGTFQNAGFQNYGFHDLGFQQPGFQQPYFQQRGFQHPGFQHPGFQHPGFQHPGFQHPGFQNFGFQQRGFGGRGGYHGQQPDPRNFRPRGRGGHGTGVENAPFGRGGRNSSGTTPAKHSNEGGSGNAVIEGDGGSKGEEEKGKDEEEVVQISSTPKGGHNVCVRYTTPVKDALRNAKKTKATPKTDPKQREEVMESVMGAPKKKRRQELEIEIKELKKNIIAKDGTKEQLKKSEAGRMKLRKKNRKLKLEKKILRFKMENIKNGILFLFKGKIKPENGAAADNCKKAVRIMEYDFPEEMNTVEVYFKNLIGYEGEEDEVAYGNEDSGIANEKSNMADDDVDDQANNDQVVDGDEEETKDKMGDTEDEDEVETAEDEDDESEEEVDTRGKEGSSEGADTGFKEKDYRKMEEEAAYDSEDLFDFSTQKDGGKKLVEYEMGASQKLVSYEVGASQQLDPSNDDVQEQLSNSIIEDMEQDCLEFKEEDDPRTEGLAKAIKQKFRTEYNKNCVFKHEKGLTYIAKGSGAFKEHERFTMKDDDGKTVMGLDGKPMMSGRSLCKICFTEFGEGETIGMVWVVEGPAGTPSINHAVWVCLRHYTNSYRDEHGMVWRNMEGNVRKKAVKTLFKKPANRKMVDNKTVDSKKVVDNKIEEEEADRKEVDKMAEELNEGKGEKNM